MSEDEWASRGLDTDTPNIARVYDYLIGGKDNFAADRQVAQMALQIAPDGPKTARANRQFLKSVVHYLAAEAGLRQFLDIGSGLPSHGNVHQIAQQVNPGIRVVYVDNDRCKLGCVHTRDELFRLPEANTGGKRSERS